MSTSNVSRLDDPHGAAGLPRLSALGKAAIAAGTSVGQNAEAIAMLAKRWAHLGDAQRATIDAIQRNAAGVQGPDLHLTSSGMGAVQTGLASLTLLGQLRGAIDVAINTFIPCLAADDVSGAVIRTPGQSIPCVRANIHRANMAATNAAAIIVASDELLQQASAETALTARIARAGVTACDAEVVSLALNGAPAVATGANTPALLLAQVNAACAVLIEAGADARFITLAANPETLLELACASTTLGTRAFPDVTAQGGTLAGLPLLASRGIAAGRIVAVAGDMVLRAPITPRVEASKNAVIEMSDAPTGAAEPETNPVSMSQQRVSMYQAGLVALKIVLTFGVDFASDVRAAYIDGISLAGDMTA
jgi:hypothetical protein